MDTILPHPQDATALGWRKPTPLRYTPHMPRDDEKLLRQLSLVSYLLSRERPSTSVEIARSVEGYAFMAADTFTRRFHSDRRDLLDRAGINICTSRHLGDEGEEAYYLTRKSYTAQSIDLTAEETSALSIALGLLEGGFAYARPLRLAIANITRGAPDPSRQELERAAVSPFTEQSSSEQDSALRRLDDAVSRGKTVRFDYRPASKTEPGERITDPYGLFLIGGHWYLVGHDRARDGIRMYRLDRISGRVRFHTDKPRDFRIPDTYDPAEYTARPPWLLADPVGTARFCIDEDLAWWVERTYPRVDRLGTASGDRVRFEAKYADADALAAWIIGLGSRAMLEEPQTLRNRIVERLRRVRDAHRDTSEDAGEPGDDSRQAQGGES